jgi:hypothetical protein
MTIISEANALQNKGRGSNASGTVYTRLYKAQKNS